MHVVITSFSNPLIKRIRTLHRARGRRSAALTLVEGPTAFTQMAAAGVSPEVIIAVEDDAETAALCSRYGWTPVLVSAEILESAGDTVHPQSPIAVIQVPKPSTLRGRNTLILVDVSDPGNVGSMIRSASAFGWDVCISGDTADPWSPKVLRSAVGTHFDVHLSASTEPVLDGRECGLEIVATVVAGGGHPDRGDRAIGLLIGSEAHGLPEEMTVAADRKVTLSISNGVESLNAGVAASILMYVLTSRGPL
jgi:TrmH family RNA methyltransferase